MPTVAEQLRAARLARNWTLQQVAEMTKLKADQVDALETANYSVFPAPVYIRGSIRTYAGFLRLDVPKLMSQLDEEFSTSRELSDPPPLTPKADGMIDWITLQLSKLDWRILAGLGALLVVLIVSWSLLHPAKAPRKQDPLSTLGSGTYKGPAPGSRVDHLPLPTNAPPAR